MRRWFRFRLFYLIIALAVVPTAAGVSYVRWQRMLEMELVHDALQRELGYRDLNVIALRQKVRRFESGQRSEAEAIVHCSYNGVLHGETPHEHLLAYVFCAGAPVEGPWFIPEELQERPLMQKFDHAPTADDVAAFAADCRARLDGEFSDKEDQPTTFHFGFSGR